MPSSTQPDRRPRCPPHLCSAEKIIRKSDGGSATSTSTAPHPARAAARAGSRPQAPPGTAATTPTIRPRHTSRQTGTRCTCPCDGKAPGGYRPARAAAAHRPPANFPGLNRPTHPAGHQKQGTRQGIFSRVRHKQGTFRPFFTPCKTEKPTICTAFLTVNREFFFGALEGTRIHGPLIKSRKIPAKLRVLLF